MKLDITTEFTVWCRRCNAWHQDGMNKSRACFERKMRGSGWGIRQGQSACPECIAELKDGKEWDDVGYRHSPR